jgi:hypothetical protein
MRRDVQRMPKSREKSTRKTHNMINQKMQRCVYGREREASLKPVEIQLLGQHMARLLSSGRRIGPSKCFTLENLKLEENMQKNIFPKS